MWCLNSKWLKTLNGGEKTPDPFLSPVSVLIFEMLIQQVMNLINPITTSEPKLLDVDEEKIKEYLRLRHPNEKFLACVCATEAPHFLIRKLLLGPTTKWMLTRRSCLCLTDRRILVIGLRGAQSNNIPNRSRHDILLERITLFLKHKHPFGHIEALTLRYGGNVRRRFSFESESEANVNNFLLGLERPIKRTASAREKKHAEWQEKIFKLKHNWGRIAGVVVAIFTFFWWLVGQISEIIDLK